MKSCSVKWSLQGGKMNKVRFLQMIIYSVSALGILMGLDLVSGAKVTSKLNKKLNRSIWDFDIAVAVFLARLRKTLDSNINWDEKIIKSKSKGVLGYLFIIICVIMIYMAKRG